jgi:hypothetical protein
MNEIIAPNKNDCQWLQAGILWCRVLGMTNEEIDKLEAGRELNILIGEKVFKWERREPDHTNCTPEQVVQPERWHQKCGWYVNDERVACIECGNISDYSRSIADAWLVVEKLKVLCSVDISTMIDKTWHVELVDDIGEFESYASTAPLGICRAALKAVNHE